MTGDDWRQFAYLSKSNWPKAIPEMGPAREQGPEPWAVADHDDRGLDDYPTHHIDAMSIGSRYGGDVCPWCGVPLRNDETVVDQSGREGTIWDLARDDVTVSVYHPNCRKERQAAIHGHENAQITDY
jgi:hypothetical protein